VGFAPGEAYQFDRSHQAVATAGAVMTVAIVHVHLCNSRMMFVGGNPRGTRQRVSGPRDQAPTLLRRACTRGKCEIVKTTDKDIQP